MVNSIRCSRDVSQSGGAAARFLYYLRFPLRLILTALLAQASLSTERVILITVAEEHHHHLEFQEIPTCAYSSSKFPLPEIDPLSSALTSLSERASYRCGCCTAPLRHYCRPRRARDSESADGAAILAPSSPAVSNTRDFPLRNVAIELLRPQGTIRNGCVWADSRSASRRPLRAWANFERDHSPCAAACLCSRPMGISVTAWRISVRIAAMPAPDDRGAILLASLSGVSVTASGGIDSANGLKGGLLWLPAGSKPVFKTEPAPTTGGHFIAAPPSEDSGSPPALL